MVSIKVKLLSSGMYGSAQNSTDPYGVTHGAVLSGSKLFVIPTASFGRTPARLKTNNRGYWLS